MSSLGHSFESLCSASIAVFQLCEYVNKLNYCIGILLLCCCDLLSLGGRETVCRSDTYCTESVGLSIGTVKGCILSVQEVATRRPACLLLCMRAIPIFCMSDITQPGGEACGVHELQKVTCVAPVAQDLSVHECTTWQCCSKQHSMSAKPQHCHPQHSICRKSTAEACLSVCMYR